MRSTDVGRQTGRTTYAVKTAIRDIRHRNKSLPIVIHCHHYHTFLFICKLAQKEAREYGLTIPDNEFIWSGSYMWRGLENFALITDHTIYEVTSPTTLREYYEIDALLQTRMRG